MKNRNEGNLLLLFIFFFLFTSFYFSISETFSGEKESFSESLFNGSPFLSYETPFYDEESLVFSDDAYLLSKSPSYFVDSQTLGMRGLEERTNESIVSHRVEEDESVQSIAEKYGINTDTIRWANDIENDDIEKGDELLILPTTGVIYYVERGDTVGRIAEIHKAKKEDIVSFNNIKENRITAGERLIIPGGEPPPAPRVEQPTPQRAPSVASSFINPVPGGVITQGVHSYNAVDIANPCGSPLLASASGRVVQRGAGTWPAGNFVKIDHGQAVFLYAHMQDIYVSTGDYVRQGQQIGTVGNTGKTVGRTGCHLHFDALSLSIRNPFAHLPTGARP